MKPLNEMSRKELLQEITDLRSQVMALESKLKKPFYCTKPTACTEDLICMNKYPKGEYCVWDSKFLYDKNINNE